jgi:hypothetical protein
MLDTATQFSDFWDTHLTSTLLPPDTNERRIPQPVPELGQWQGNDLPTSLADDFIRALKRARIEDWR